MAMTLCEYCRTRVPKNKMELHFKHCIRYKRAKAAGKLKKSSTVKAKDTSTSKVKMVEARILELLNEKTNKKTIVNLISSQFEITKKEAAKLWKKVKNAQTKS